MQLFSNIFNTSTTSITLIQLLLTFGTSLFLGFVVAAVYKYRSQYTKEFIVTLILLPTLIAIIIFLINGNLGTSVAVAGAFSLIRFRSAAATSKDLLAVFLATAIGLATGMGYLTLAVAFTLLVSAVLVIFEHTGFTKINEHSRHILLTVDKDFNYEDLFARQFGADCRSAELSSIQYKKKKEVFVLEYLVLLDKRVSDKQIIDKLLLAEPRDIILNRRAPKQKRL